MYLSSKATFAERFKQSHCIEWPPTPPKNGYCREVDVSGGSTVVFFILIVERYQVSNTKLFPVPWFFFPYLNDITINRNRYLDWVLRVQIQQEIINFLRKFYALFTCFGLLLSVLAMWRRVLSYFPKKKKHTGLGLHCTFCYKWLRRSSKPLTKSQKPVTL